MLDQQYGISNITQFTQGFNEPVGVARVQAGGRLVKHIRHPNQPRSHLGRQPDTLKLPTTEGLGRPVKCQI